MVLLLLVLMVLRAYVLVSLSYRMGFKRSFDYVVYWPLTLWFGGPSTIWFSGLSARGLLAFHLHSLSSFDHVVYDSGLLILWINGPSYIRLNGSSTTCFIGSNSMVQ